MTAQLLMIIAVILSSLLTISQRANAQEVSQFRWLEPSVEQRFNEVIAPDQELDSDNNFIASSFSIRKRFFELTNTLSSYYYFPNKESINSNISPRAPPFSLI
ncbi:hypothetical protein ACMUMQ_15445 [Marinomonas sp. 2405UD66-6]|uniref:hypothetical protein n=1 Tax=Marinomonas sp. 2405UD66-6 TaxID=3391834 RepID=UPI0039C8CFB0